MGASPGFETTFGLISVVLTDSRGESQLHRHTSGTGITEKRGPDE
jgi:hypothetical protein